MFQRIQTLFILLAVAATSVSFVFPVATAAVGEAKFTYSNYGLYMLGEKANVKVVDSFIYIIAAAVLVFLLFALSQYKKRALQVKVCRLTYLLILAQFALCFFMPDRTLAQLKLAGEISMSYGIAFFMPLVALVFTFLAERFIRKDEQLVKSADRLR